MAHERTFIPVDPMKRQVHKRHTARIIVRCQGQILLMHDSDPGLVDSSWWTTPGGGIDPGETPSQAAVRELREETGFEASEDRLIGPIATAKVIHGYSDQVLVQDDVFYALDVAEPFIADNSGYTDDEKVCMGEACWFPIDQLPCDEPVWPKQICELYASDGSTGIDMGVDEQSTVPVDDALLR